MGVWQRSQGPDLILNHLLGDGLFRIAVLQEWSFHKHIPLTVSEVVSNFYVTIWILGEDT